MDYTGKSGNKSPEAGRAGWRNKHNFLSALCRDGNFDFSNVLRNKMVKLKIGVLVVRISSDNFCKVSFEVMTFSFKNNFGVNRI